MTNVRQADRAFPPVAIYQIVALVAALLVAGIVALSAFGPFNVQLPQAGDPGVSPSVLEAGRQWELQRMAMSGDLAPVIRTGDEWEKQRRDQSPIR